MITYLRNANKSANTLIFPCGLLDKFYYKRKYSKKFRHTSLTKA
jgi:hypothetical protein